MNNSTRAYEFMLRIKQNGFELSREEDPELYASYNELIEELDAFAKLEQCEFHRSRKRSVIHLVPTNESRYAYSNTELRQRMKLADVGEVFLSDFATLILITMFFNPRAVEFKVRHFVSLSEWETAVTRELNRLSELEGAEESLYQNGYDLKELVKQWNNRHILKEDDIKNKDSRAGFLEKVGRYLIKRNLLTIRKESEETGDGPNQIDYEATLRFEDLSEHLLRKQSTLRFLSQLNQIEENE